MRIPFRLLCAASIAALLAACGWLRPSAPTRSPMTFFVTSVGLGQGASLGGLASADRHCQALAESVGAGSRTWHAYLSTNVAGGGAVVNARDRIGSGPWRNARGELIANNVDELHSNNNRIAKQTALTEKGTVVNGRGDNPNEHDILTGSTADGRAAAQTCNNWTTSGDGAAAIVGHHDRQGLQDTPEQRSWNSSHPTRGCGQEALKASGGAGYLYCFAVN